MEHFVFIIMFLLFIISYTIFLLLPEKKKKNCIEFLSAKDMLDGDYPIDLVEEVIKAKAQSKEAKETIYITCVNDEIHVSYYPPAVVKVKEY